MPQLLSVVQANHHLCAQIVVVAVVVAFRQRKYFSLIKLIQELAREPVVVVIVVYSCNDNNKSYKKTAHTEVTRTKIIK